MAQLARGGEQYNLGPIVVIPAYSVITVVMVKQRVGQLVIIIIIILDTKKLKNPQLVPLTGCQLTR